MKTIWDGIEMNLVGDEVVVGQKAPNFEVCDNAMNKVTLKDTKGLRVFLAVPSVDTPVCDMEVRRFNEEATKLENVTVYAVSVDLPFAQERWCGAAGVDRVVTLSDYKDRSFGKNYGILIDEVQMFSRASYVVNENDEVIYVEYCKDASDHPNYDAILAALK